jgi:hypothetical protein
MKATSKIVLTLSCAALSMAAINNGNQVPTLGQTPTPVDPSTAAFNKTVAFISANARGFIQGYEIGMYKNTNYKNPDQCFGPEAQALIVGVFDDWNTPNFDWGTEIVSIQKALLMITDWCQYDEALYQYLEFCYSADACEIPNMINTLFKKVFQVTTVANDIAQVFMEGLPTQDSKVADIEQFANRVGQDVGKLLRYATDFDPTQVQLEY